MLGNNFIKAGVPSIRFFAADVETIEPDAPLMLFWRVENAEDLTIRRVSNAGPDFNGAQFIKNPQGFSYLLSPVPFNSFVQIEYELEAKTPCGKVKQNLLVAGSKRPNLAIETMEVTQGIQTIDNEEEYPDNGLRLVSKKSTVVRVQISHALSGFGTDQVPIRGRLRIGNVTAGLSPWLDPINSPNPGPPVPTPQEFLVPSPATFRRDNTNDTLNFLLPLDSCQGKSTITVEIEVADFGADPMVPNSGYSETVTQEVKVEFQPRRHLKIFYITWPYQGQQPSKAQAEDVLRRAVALHPTPGAVINTWTQIIGNAGSNITNPQSMSDLDALIHIISGCEWYDPGDTLHGNCTKGSDIYAVMTGTPPGGRTLFWVYYKPVAWGLGGFDKRIKTTRVFFAPTLRSEDDNVSTTAHELGHTLNQVSEIERGPDSTWPNQGYCRDVPFNIMNNVAVKPAKDSGYPGVPELMVGSALTPIWPSPKRWEWAFDKIGE